MDASPIPIIVACIDNRLVQSVNARDLYFSIRSSVKYPNWIKNRVLESVFENDLDYVRVENFSGSSRKVTPGQKKQLAYSLSLDMAIALALMEQNKQGREVGKYLIECKRNPRLDQDDVLDFLGVNTKLLKKVFTEHIKGKIRQDGGMIVIENNSTDEEFIIGSVN